LEIQAGPDHGTASVVVAGQALSLSLEETSSKQVHRQTEAEKTATRRQGYASGPLYDFVPSGKMGLRIENLWQAGVQTSWRDTSARKLEDRLNEVMAGLYRAAHVEELKSRKERERKRRVDAENARRAALRQEREDEVHFLKGLEADATAWQRAQTLRAFIAAVEAQRDEARNDEEKMAWLARARRLADRVDPLLPNPPSPLDYDDQALRALYGWETLE
jgi:hypothetical protein